MIRTTATILAMTVLGFLISATGLVLAPFGRSRRLASWGARIWSDAILAVAGVQLHVEGQDRLPPGEAVFLAGNHQSAMDIPILLKALRGDVRFMA